MDRRETIRGIIGCFPSSIDAHLVAIAIDAELPPINWRPIAELPEDPEQYMEALFWCGQYQAPTRGFYDRNSGGWCYDLEGEDNDWTHFCEINPPEADSVRTNKPEG